MENFSIYVFLTSYLIGLVLYKYKWVPNPIMWIWKITKYLEKSFLKYHNKRLAGIVLVTIIVGSTFAVSHSIIKLFFIISPFLGLCIAIYISYVTFWMKSLDYGGNRVFNALKSKNINLARKNTSKMVSRNTANLNESDMIQGTIESIAENTVDGVIAPLFYLILGGAPLAITFGVIDSLDLTMGFKNEKYKDFGWAAAKLDDIASFIPARITGLLIPLAALMLGKNFKNSFKIMLRDRKKHPSPNSGIPESAVAGALEIRLGGDYSEKKSSWRPYIGDKKNILSPEHIKDSIQLMYTASGIMIMVSIFSVFIIRFLLLYLK